MLINKVVGQEEQHELSGNQCEVLFYFYCSKKRISICRYLQMGNAGSIILPTLSALGQLNTTDAVLWTGLNRLEEGAGWQWSDGAPLVFVNWKAGTWICYSSVIACSL